MAIKKISANLLANNAVHTANIASGAISAADIADNSITAAKISTSTFAIDSLTVNTSDLVVDTANNRVGIGEASPVTPLHVKMATGKNILFQDALSSAAIKFTTDAGAGYAAGTINGSSLAINADSGGNLAVGGTTPVAKLHVQGTGTSGQVSTSFLLENASSGTAGMDITGAAGSSRLRFLYGGGPSTGTNTLTEALNIVLEGSSAGNVGIGRTPNANGILQLNVASGNYCNITFSENTTEKFLIGSVPGDDAFRIYDLVNSAERMRIDSSGNVGIGTSSPTVPLQINHGSSSVGLYTLGGYNYQAKFESTDAEAAIVIEDSNSTTDGNRIGVITDDMTFITAGSERMRIDSSGNVGIGTSSPDAQLDISGAGTSTRGLQITATAASGYAEAQFVADSREWRIGSGGSTGIFPNMFYIYDQQGGSGRLLIDSATGDVRLVGGNQMTNALSWWNGGTGYELASIENASHPSYNDSGGLVFKTAKTSSGGMAEAMRIDSQGFVGMGTNNPLNKLHVQLPTGQNGDMLRLSRAAGAYSFQVGVDGSSSYYVSNNSSTKIIDANYQGWVTHPQQPHIVFSPRNSTGSGYATHHHEDTTYSRSTLSTTTVGGYARVTVPTAGLYLVTFYSIGNNENSVRRDMYIAVNGSQVATSLTEYNTNGFKYRCITITLDLSANDYLTFSNDNWYDYGSAGATTWRKVSITLIG